MNTATLSTNTNMNRRTSGTNPPLDGAMKRAIQTSNVRNTSRYGAPLPSPERWAGDGIDHCNIWTRGRTELGECLAFESRVSLNHPIFGDFKSLEGFWYYIASLERDDQLRVLTGKRLADHSRTLTKVKIRHFPAIICDANWHRIVGHKALAEEVRHCTLPFDSYSVTMGTGLKVRSQYVGWTLAGINEIRTALQQDREPDWGKFVDHPTKDIYEDVRPKIQEQPEMPRGNRLMDRLKR